MGRIKKLLILCVVGSFTLSLRETAWGAEKSLPRKILCVYDSSEVYEGRSESSLIHTTAEMILNYLGMQVKYFDVQKGIPTSEDMAEVSGILTWFQDNEMPNARDYCLWATRQIERGIKFVILENMGAFRDQKTQEPVQISVINQLFRGLGLYYEGNWSENPFVIRIASKAPRMVEFERSLENEAVFYEKFKSLNPENKVYLQLDRVDLLDAVSDAVVTTPHGALAMSSYVIFVDNFSGICKWRINPFLFFEEAFGLDNMPRYDTTTVLGRRIFYSHIDGDGFRNLSEFKPAFSGEVVRDEVIKAYPLPMTVSFIIADIDPRYMGSRNLRKIAKSILELPNVEVGVHSFSHPLDWVNQYVSYKIPGYSQKVDNGDEDLFNTAQKFSQKGYHVKVGLSEYLKREIKDAVEYTNNVLAPSGKKVELFQWTGNCLPPAEAIAVLDEMDVRNINGGDSRFDRANPSYTGVAPLVRQTSGRVQFYPSNANENIYTNEWHGPFDWFSQLIDTFKQTESPTLVNAVARRVSPINVYYHFYSGEKTASISALKKAYDYVMSADVIPLFTSEYIDIVKGFLRGKISKTGDGGWRFFRYGACRTVRFDNQSFDPDLARSKGIVGFGRWHNSLYVYLSEGDSATLYFSEQKSQVDIPYITEASNLLWNWSMTQAGGKFTTRGFKEGYYRLANMSPQTSYTVETQDNAANLIDRQEIKTDESGFMIVKAPVSGQAVIRVLKNTGPIERQVTGLSTTDVHSEERTNTGRLINMGTENASNKDS